MSTPNVEVIVVGSGASAVHAAWALLDRNISVEMVDVGSRDKHYSELLPDRDFVGIRTGEQEQHRYFLGDKFEGVPFGNVRVGAQLTPGRQFIVRHAEQLQPLFSDSFSPMQSLAMGGLGSGWGAGAVPYIGEELDDYPITRDDLTPHYNAVIERIGVCGPKSDDLSPFLGPMEGLLPPAELDTNGDTVLFRYNRVRNSLNAKGFYVGRPRLAMCTVEHHGRGPLKYSDMEFWSDRERAVYRPAFTVEELKRRFPKFVYTPGLLAQEFREEADGSGVTLIARTVAADGSLSGEPVERRARRLALAAGTFGTARIVARSRKLYGIPIPMVCNPYIYYPCININAIGTKVRDRRHSLTQLSMIYDPDGTRRHLIQPQLYSYRSLLLFKLMKESPLSVKESRALMQLLCEYFVILGVHYEDRPGPEKNIRVERGRDGLDAIHAEYRQSPEEERQNAESERKICGFLRQLRCFPIKAVRPGPGSSIHYGGTFPMRRDEAPNTTSPEGKLRGTSTVWLADGSTLPHLPAKGLTLTLMANADRIGTHLAREMTAP